ncbi:amino acid adenylation domain-containing protein [Streptomyces sp. NPDC059697]|uniref:amino acid adenylation domain-containing protein n=1 Tax=Streptomyces sp. NPDC059697 TaxID=3346912 RepID=UPI00368E5E79
MRIPNGLTHAPETLADLLRQRADQQPTHEAFTFLPDDPATGESTRVTYEALNERARQLAAVLHAQGMRPGDRSMLLYAPGPDYLVAFFGCLYAGIVAVPVYPPDLQRWERGVERLRAVARDAEPRCVLTTAEIAALARDLLLQQAPELGRIEWLSTDELPAQEYGTLPELGPDSLAFLQYTSGSTSAPRGVRLTHANLLHNLGLISDFFELDARSKGVIWLPPYHDMGLIGGVLGPVHGGFPVTLLSPMAFLTDPMRWLRTISETGATASGGPNFAFELCARRATPENTRGLDLSRWQVAFCGAEPIRPSTLERFAEVFAPFGFRHDSFYPCYGLAEATLIATGGRRGAPPVVRKFARDELAAGKAVAAADGRALVGCGTGAPDQRLRVVDPDTRLPVPDGTVGEVWLSGPSVASGYWTPGEADRDTFAARLANADATAWLRTGDLAFVDAGEVFVTGRLKDLIIVRGRNHYPQDLELTSENSHPALRRGGAAAFAVQDDGTEAVVIVQEVDRRYDGADWDELSTALARAVAAEHDLAVRDVVLVKAGVVPKTSSGKVQRRACRAAFLDGELSRLGGSLQARPPVDDVSGEHTPQTWRALPAASVDEALRERIRAMLAALTGTAVTAQAVEVPLPALGVDSLGAVELMQKLRTETGIDLPVSALLGGTVASLAAEIADRMRTDSPAVPDTHARQVRAGTPMTAGQQALWFLQDLEPESTAYLIARAVRLDGALDIEALRTAFGLLTSRHEALRTCFPLEGDQPVARVRDDAVPDFEFRDATGLSPDVLAAELSRAATEPFDLADGPLLRVRLLRTDTDRHLMVLTAHHLVVDLWSLSVLVAELQECYRAARANGTDPLPPSPAFSDFARWQELRADDPSRERDTRYWCGQLAAPLPELSLPAPVTPEASRAATANFALDGALAARVRTYAAESGTTVFTVLLAAYTALLHQLTGQDDLVVGTPVATREWPGSPDFVGYAVNSVAIRSDLTGGPTFASLVAQTADTLGAALDHRDLPFPALVEQLQPHRTIGRSPVFQTMFVLQNLRAAQRNSLTAFAVDAPDAALEFDGLRASAVQLPAMDSQFDLSLVLAPDADALLGRIEYDPSRVDTHIAQAVGERYATLLRNALDAPDGPIAQVSGLTEAERRLTLKEWNRTERDFGDEICLHDLVLDQAARTPDATALRHGTTALTYAELEERTVRLADRLRGAGVGRGDRVAVFLDRGPELVTGLLAVLRTGAAYVPLDPSYPHARLAAIVADSGASVVLTAQALRTKLPGAEATVLLVDATADDGVVAQSADGAPAPTPGDAAYVLFTSGSTGRPKGVAIAHRNAVNMVRWALEEFRREDLSGVLGATSVCFDLSVFELFVPLACGGTVILADNALSLLDHPARDLVTLVNTVPSAVEELLHNDGLPRTVRVVNLAGEALAPQLVARIRAAGPPDREVYNLYGPSETTTYSTFVRLVEGDGVSVGGPVANTQVFVLDGGLTPVPVGVCGELFIGGAGVAWGYWGRPSLTAERFVPDVFGGGGGRLYRTGDVVRWRSDGRLEFVGRADHQVKVRGFRIELGEVEAVVRRHTQVRACVVTVAGSGAGARLVAYVVPNQQEDNDEGFIAPVRQWCRGRLPEYMVPSGWVALSALPLTPNGKVDRAALPDPGGASAVVADFVAPESQTQHHVAQLWQELLGLERVGLRDNFFDLGGHSLLAARTVARLRADREVAIPLGMLFAHPLLGDFADRLDEFTSAPARPAAIAAPGRRGDEAYESRATNAQERLWFLQQLDPGAGRAYHVHGLCRLDGPVDRVALQRALNDLVRRHHTLRTRFQRVAAELRQIVEPRTGVVLGVADLRGLPAEQRADAVRAAAREQGRRPFSLDEAPLLRATLFRLGAAEHVLAVTTHHIVSDGWSVQVLVRELIERYEHHVAGGPTEEPEQPRLQYADYAEWARTEARSDRLAEQRDYWTSQLAGLPDLQMPTDRPRPAVQNFEGATVRFPVPADLVRALQQRCRDEDVTLYMAALAAWTIVLGRHANQEDFGVGTPMANRPLPELESLIGFFANTVVVRADLTAGPSVRELLRRMRAVCLDAYAYSEVPFESLVEALHPHRTPDRNPIFQVMFGLHQADLGPIGLGEATLTPLQDDPGGAKFDLSLFLTQDGEQLQAMLEYRTSLFDAATVRRLQQHFLAALAAVAYEPACPVDEVPLLSSEERERITTEWNDTDTAVPEPLVVPLRLAEQAARTPQAVALEHAGGSLTYRELCQRVEQIRRALRQRGVEHGDRVAVCLERGPDLVSVLLGVLACGAAYLPLDPHHPDDRLGYILADAKPKLVVLEDPAAPFAAGLATLVPPALEDGAPGDVAREWCGNVGPQDLAYLIYTSGSTGRPKGVMVPHGALGNFLTAMAARLPLDGDDVFVAVTTPSFDIAALELFLPLTLGMRTVVASWEHTTSGAELAGLLARSEATAMQATPVTWRLLLDAGWRGPADFVALCGGEALPADTADELLRAGVRLWNLYGPTETTIWSCATELVEGDGVSVGGPVANTQVFVLDGGLTPVPVGVCGELFIGGAGVAWGYWGRPSLTAERFVPDVFGGGGGRLYRTGDVVRWRSDGRLEFVGRADHQVKVRGFRIELGEVEAVVRRHTQVRACVVTVAGSGAGARLVAYVVPNQQEDNDEGFIAPVRQWCRGRLPEYMVPSGWVALSALPLTPNGKVDRAALPDPGGASAVVADFVAPESQTQHHVAQLWQELLGLERVGLRDNFFDLGGHSLLAARMVAELRENLGADVPMRDVFLDSTLEAVSAAVDRARGSMAQGTGAHGAEDSLLDNLARLPLGSFEAMLADPSLTAPTRGAGQ